MPSVDQRVVQMQFDNKQFERGVQQSLNTLNNLEKSLQFKNSTKGLDKLQAAVQHFDFSSMQSSLSTLSDRFSTFGIVGMRVVQNLTDKAMAAFSKLPQALSGVTNQIKTGGVSRALNLEQARFMLKGLTGDLNEVAKIIDGPVNDAVTGTRFGLDAAAVASANLYASGITDSKELTKSLQAISGAATMTNREYGDMADIFATVKSNGKLMTMQLRQFSAMGMNVSAELAKSLGKTEQEINEMVTQGAITYDQFVDVMYKYWDLAADANSTYAGSLSNVKAQLSKVGEVVASQYFASMINVNTALITFIKAIKVELAPAYRVINKAIEEGTTSMAKFISDSRTLKVVQNIIKGLANVMEALEPAVKAVGKAFKEAFPGDLLDTMLESSKAFKKTTKAFKEYMSIGEDRKMEKTLKTRKEDAKALQKIINKYGIYNKEALKNANVSEKEIATLKKKLGLTDETMNLAKKNLKAYKEETETKRAQLSVQEQQSKKLHEIAERYGFTNGKMQEGILLSSKEQKLIKKTLGLETGSNKNLMENLALFDKENEKLSANIKKRDSSAKSMAETIKQYNLMNYAQGKGNLLTKDELKLVKQTLGLDEKELGYMGKELKAYKNTTKELKKQYDAEKDIRSARSGTKEFSDILSELFIRVKRITDLGADMKKAFGDFLKSDLGQNIKKNLVDIFREFANAVDVAVYAIEQGIRLMQPFARVLGDVFGAVSEIASMLARIGGEYLDIFAEAIFGDEWESVNKNVDSVRAAIDAFLPSSEKIAQWGHKVAEGLSEIIPYAGDVLETIQNVASKIKEVFGGGFDTVKKFAEAAFDFGWLHNFDGLLERIKIRFEQFKEAVGGFEGIWGKVKAFFSGIFASIKEVCGVIKELFTPVMDEMKKAFEDFFGGSPTFNTFIDIFNSAVFATFLAGLANMSGNLSKVSEDMKEIADGKKSFLDAFIPTPIKDAAKTFKRFGTELSNTLKVIQNSVNADIILKIASAVGILAASMFALSLVDSDKLAAAMSVMTVAFLELFGALKFMQESNLLDKKDGITGTLIGMSVALLIFAGAITKLAALDPQAMAQGLAGTFAVLIMMLTSLYVITNNLGENTGVMLAAAGAMTIMAVALNIIAGAVALFGAIPTDNLIQGLIGMAVALGLMVAALFGLSKMGPMMIVGAAAMLVLSVSMSALAGAVAIFGAIPMDNLYKGLISLTIALGVMCAALFALSLMGPMTIVGAGAMLILSNAMLVLAAALAAFGAIDPDRLISAFIAMGGALAILVAGLMLLVPVGPLMIVASAGLLVAAAALLVLATALNVLSLVPAGSLLGMLGTVAVALGVLAAAGILILPALPGLIGLGAALLAIGAGAALAGVGLLLVGTGMSILASALTLMGGTDVGKVAAGILELAGALAALVIPGALMLPIAPILLIFAAAVAILAASAGVAAVGLVPFTAAMNGLAKLKVKEIAKQTGELASAFTTLAKAVVGMSKLALTLASITSATLVLAATMPRVTTAIAGFTGQTKLMAVQLAGVDFSPITREFTRLALQISVSMAIVNKAMSEAGRTMIIAMANSVTKNSNKLYGEIKLIFAKTYLEANAQTPKFIVIGMNIVLGMITGMKKKQQTLYKAAYKLGEEAKKAAMKALDEHSPSKVFMKIGAWCVEGFVKGIDKSSKKAYKKVTKFAKQIVKEMKNATINATFGGDISVDLAKHQKLAKLYKEQIADAKFNREQLLNDMKYQYAFDKASSKLSAKQMGELEYLQGIVRRGGELSLAQWKKLGKLLKLDKFEMQELVNDYKQLGKYDKEIDKLTSKWEKQKTAVEEIKKLMEEGVTNVSYDAVKKYSDEAYKAMEALGTALYQQTDEFKQNTEAIKANNETIKAAKEAKKELKSTMADEKEQINAITAAITGEYATRKPLMKLTKEQKAELDAIQDKMKKGQKLTKNEIYLLASYTRMTEAEVKALIEANKEGFSNLAYRKSSEKLKKDEIKTLNKLQKKMREGKELTDDEIIQLATLLGIKGKELKNLKAELEERKQNNEALAENKEQYSKLNDAIDECTENNKTLAQAIEEGPAAAFTELYNTIHDTIENAIDPLNTALSDSIDLFGKFGTTKLSVELDDYLSETSDDTRRKDAIISQLRGFGLNSEILEELKNQSVDELEKWSDLTIAEVAQINSKFHQDLIKNIDSFGSVYDEYKATTGADFANLYAKGFSELVVERLRALGPAGLDIIKQYLSFTDAEVQAANAAMIHSTNATFDEWLETNKQKIAEQQSFIENLNKLLKGVYVNGEWVQLSDAAYQDFLSKGAEAASGIVEGMLTGSADQVAAKINSTNALFDEVAKLPDALTQKAMEGAAASGSRTGNSWAEEFINGISSEFTDPAQYEAGLKTITAGISKIMKEAAKEADESVEETLVEAGTTLGTYYVDGMSAYFDEDGWIALNDAAVDLGDGAVDGVEEDMNRSTGKKQGNNYGNGIVSGLDSKASNVNTSGQGVGEAGKSGVETYLSRSNGAEIGRQMDDGLVAGLYENGGAVAAAATAVAYQAYTAAMAALQVGSPSKKFAEIGMYADLGFAKGLSAYAHVVTQATEGVAGGSLDSMREAIASISDDLSSTDNTPVIKPILDLSNVSRGAIEMKRMFDASHIPVDATVNAADEAEDGSTLGGNSYVFNQYNTSPKALSRIDIYRQTKNQFAMLKGATQ